MLNNKFYYISADCGSGKTKSIIKLAEKNKYKHILFIQPTLQLISETKKQLKKCNCLEITSNNSDNVAIDINKQLKNKNYNVILITFEAFKMLSNDDFDGWYVVFDDITKCTQYLSINEDNANIKRIISEQIVSLSDKNKYINGYSSLQFKQNINKGGELYFDIYNKLQNFQYYDYSLVNCDWFDYEKVKQLHIIGWVDFSKLKNAKKVFFIANNFELSECYYAITNLLNISISKINFVPKNVRSKNTKKRLIVKYFMEDRYVSATLKSDYRSEFNKVINYLEKQLTNQEYIWTSNNSDNFNLDKNKKISPDPRGINKYIDHYICVFLASLKPSIHESKLMSELFGITYNEILYMREYEALYQFVNRTNLRDYNSDKDIVVYVLDSYQAKFLSNQIEYIDLNINFETNKIGRPNCGLPRNLQKSYSIWLKRNMDICTNKDSLFLFLYRFRSWLNKMTDLDKKHERILKNKTLKQIKEFNFNLNKSETDKAIFILDGLKI